MFESLQDYKMQGSGVLFNPNGQKALEAIDADLLERCVFMRCQGCILTLVRPLLVAHVCYNLPLRPEAP